MWPVTEMAWPVTLVALFNTDSEPKTNSTSKYSEGYVSLLHFRKMCIDFPKGQILLSPAIQIIYM